jgi:hypothetical protein
MIRIVEQVARQVTERSEVACGDVFEDCSMIDTSQCMYAL